MQKLLTFQKSPLLSELQSLHPNGIYTPEDFKKNIIPGKKVYIVQCSVDSDNPTKKGVFTTKKKLKSTEPYKGRYRDFKGDTICTFKDEKEKCNLRDLFAAPNACFTSSEDAEAYQKSIFENLAALVA